MFRNFLRIAKPTKLIGDLVENIAKRFPRQFPKNVKQKNPFQPPTPTDPSFRKIHTQPDGKKTEPNTKTILSSFRDKFKINLDKLVSGKDNKFADQKASDELTGQIKSPFEPMLKKDKQGIGSLLFRKKESAESESLNRVAKEISNLSGRVADLVDKTLEQDKNQKIFNGDQLQAIKNNLIGIESVVAKKGDEQVQLLQELIKNLYQLTEQTILSRQESSKQLETISRVDREELEKILTKMDEAINGKLGMYASYATILGMIVGFVGLVYQYQLEKDKQKDAIINDVNQLKTSLKKTQKEIERIQSEIELDFNKKSVVETNIQHLEKRKDDLIQMEKTRWLPSMGFNAQIQNLDQTIEEKKNELKRISNEMGQLEVNLTKKLNKKEEIEEKQETGLRF